MQDSVVPSSIEPLAISIDRGNGASLAEQIHAGIEGAIRTGVLLPGTRLPSWQSLAVQLGVARGTVLRPYSSLAAAHWVTSTPTIGTYVAERVDPAAPLFPHDGPLPDGYQYYGGPAPFQMGVPARDLFPAKTFAKLHARCARAEAVTPDLYPDPRGAESLRREIAAHQAIARGINCAPSQVFVTGGFLAGLGMMLRILDLHGAAIWTEDPCFPVARKALHLSGLRLIAVLVDAEGIDVGEGRERAPDARAVLVTPGQQAPLGMPLSLNRRRALLAWAEESHAWIIEDDYLGELQLRGRAAPALASTDPVGRVINIGSFAKTISPVNRIGFVVVPPALVPAFTDANAYAGGVPGTAIQGAIATFLHDGHYLRHLRRVKRALAVRADGLLLELRQRGLSAEIAGPAAVVRLPTDVDDIALAEAASQAGIAPAPLSCWYADPIRRRSGLLLGVASALKTGLARDCDQLASLIMRAKT